jgi:hypothetical protein
MLRGLGSMRVQINHQHNYLNMLDKSIYHMRTNKTRATSNQYFQDTLLNTPL